ncbi:MAG: 6-carboxytetrahydropterin synthase QueD [Candidatus Rokubacteria bacterium]|nr:6-carboxytetrahydropterin synthase QueD [Candidatus Rokubacteria bacterium]
MRLSTEFTFDAAHRILGHPGKCAFLHGHTYHLEVTVGAENLDRLGMIIDFDDLRTIVRKAVLDQWDHATLLSAEDPLCAAIERVQAEAPEKVVRLDGNPTAEILTREAWRAIGSALPRGISLERVAIRETPTCSSELTRERA